MTQPEAPLWHHLDACNIGFRQPRQHLMSDNGIDESGWSDGLWFCHLKTAQPFIANLAHPVFFNVQDRSDLKAPFEALFGYIRVSEDHNDNLALACDSLTALFGEGRDSSASNTISRRWEMGLASVEVRVFPPELNADFGKNARYDLIPGSKTECSLTITPAWRVPLTMREAKWLISYQSLFTAHPDDAAPFRLVDNITADWPASLARQSPGFGISGDGDAVLHITNPALVNIVPRRWVSAVQVVNLLPARGSGGASIELDYHPGGQTHLEQSLTLVGRAGKPDVLDAFGAELAGRLGVDCNIVEYLDD